VIPLAASSLRTKRRWDFQRRRSSVHQFAESPVIASLVTERGGTRVRNDRLRRAVPDRSLVDPQANGFYILGLSLPPRGMAGLSSPRPSGTSALRGIARDQHHAAFPSLKSGFA